MKKVIKSWRILIDDREKDSAAMVMRFASHSVQTEIQRLPKADLWVVSDEGQTMAALERKTPEDLDGSIDGVRYRMQAAGLLKHFSDVPFVGYIYVDDRKPLRLRSASAASSASSMAPAVSMEAAQRARRDKLENALLHLQVPDPAFPRELKVIVVDSEDALVRRVVRLMRYLRDEEHSFSAPGVELALSRPAKRKFATPRKVWTQQLMCIDGMSAEKAMAVVAAYPKPRDLIAAYDAAATTKAKDALLTPIETGKNKRKLGGALSSRIRRCVDPTAEEYAADAPDDAAPAASEAAAAAAASEY